MIAVSVAVLKYWILALINVHLKNFIYSYKRYNEQAGLHLKINACYLKLI